MTPLDEILEAAGIPAAAPPRVLARRDGHRVVTSQPDTWIDEVHWHRALGFAAHFTSTDR